MSRSRCSPIQNPSVKLWFGRLRMCSMGGTYGVHLVGRNWMVWKPGEEKLDILDGSPPVMLVPKHSLDVTSPVTPRPT